MTEGTQTIARLDRTQPPPGYTLTPSCGVWVADEGGALIREDESFDGEASAIAAAWSHYERERDPPGLCPGRLGGVLNSDLERADYDPRVERLIWTGVFRAVNGILTGSGEVSEGRAWPTMAEARAAAWAWYWRRLALSRRLCDEGPMGVVVTEGRALACGVDHWPRCLAWPDEQVSAVERWLAEGGDLPEVLRP